MSLKLNYPIIRKVSAPVEKLSDIKADIDRMSLLLERGNFPGNHKEAIALAHVQLVQDAPLRFFVVHPKFVVARMFPSGVIINPVIIEKSERKERSSEGCMSFPFREEKEVLRHWIVVARFQTLESFAGKNLGYQEQEFYGLGAAVMQHEIDHFNNKTIYG